MRDTVTDYLLSLEENALIKIAAEFMGWEPDDIDPPFFYNTALEWVDGLSDDEVKTIWAEMEGA